MRLFRRVLSPMETQTGKATGMNALTPSRSEYFSWINNTNEGATEAQTLTNLEFFKWLHDEYGMDLDIYAFDAGNIDGPGFYGSMKSFKFKQQFPRGFGPIAEKAKSFGCKIGLWGGPDGFGNTPEEAKARIDMMVSLCRDFEFSLFKFDGVCGGLRHQKQDEFVQMMQECRKYSPNLIALNHRLNLGKGFPYATTYLLWGQETYIDVFMNNSSPAPHHRGGALSRASPSDLVRMTEDHGVCISSCVDFWEDDLILQAFNRCLLLAPQIYGSPWFLPDDDYPKLARIFNLHKRFRDILVNGLVLPPDQYGPHAVSRGNEKIRLITLRNLTWEPKQYRIQLDASIGLTARSELKVHVWQFHPLEKIIGEFTWGSDTLIEVPAYRSLLLLVSCDLPNEIGVKGPIYEILKDVPHRPVEIMLYGLPGTSSSVQLISANRTFSHAHLDDLEVSTLVKGESKTIDFGGEPLKLPWHRKLADLKSCSIPENAEALYEATCFAADNNALELRELQKVGISKIPQVQAARDAFLKQPLLSQRGVWDKFAFDGRKETYFSVHQARAPYHGTFRVDFGELLHIDRVLIYGQHLYLDTKTHLNSTIKVMASADLQHWLPLSINVTTMLIIEGPSTSIRYLKIYNLVDDVTEIEGYCNDQPLDRSKWRASNLFPSFGRIHVKRTWTAEFILEEIPINSYLAVPIYGIHGREGAYVGFLVDSHPVGAPDRSPSFNSNVWEHYTCQSSMGYTYYLPLTPAMQGKRIQVFVLGFKGFGSHLKPEAWITAHPPPYQKKRLILS